MTNICPFCGCNEDVEKEMFGLGPNGEGAESLSRRQFMETGHRCWGTNEMNLTQLIKDIKEKGLISVAPLRLDGEPKEVLKFWNLMATTDPEETDPKHLAIRFWLRRN